MTYMSSPVACSASTAIRLAAPNTAHRLSAALDAAGMRDPAGEVTSNHELISIILEQLACGWMRHPPSADADDSDSDSHDGRYGPQPHDDYDCDVCGAFPIVGIRYHSTERRNYDACEACHAKLPEEEKADYHGVKPTVLPTREEAREEKRRMLQSCPSVGKTAALRATHRDLKVAAHLGRAWRAHVAPLLAANEDAHSRAKVAAYRELYTMQQQLMVESMMERMGRR